MSVFPVVPLCAFLFLLLSESVAGQPIREYIRVGGRIIASETSGHPQVTVTIQISGAGAVGGFAGGLGPINCSSALCSFAMPAGTVVTLTQSGGSFASWSGACSGSLGCSFTANANVTVTASFNVPVGYSYLPLTPCRVADTRNTTALGGNSTRSFSVSNLCNVPGNAVAYALNVTLVPSGPVGFITIWPTGQNQPAVSTMNNLEGRIKANAAIVPAGTGGSVTVFSTDTTHVILDVSGAFVPTGTPNSLDFFPLTPCRVADTANPTGALGGPALSANTVRDFPIRSSGCGIPSEAKAYSLNFTVVPPGPLGFLTVWPKAAGVNQPAVSTLNNLTGTVLANAAIVAAGDTANNGAISVFATDATRLIIDVNGYFAPPAAAGRKFYTWNPCRVADTRIAPATQMGASETRPFPVQSTPCGSGMLSSASAYVVNATVLPSGVFAYLTLWGPGNQPVVSTLNAVDGAITSNMAIVQKSGVGGFNAFTASIGHLLFDISGYFAP